MPAMIAVLLVLPLLRLFPMLALLLHSFRARLRTLILDDGTTISLPAAAPSQLKCVVSIAVRFSCGVAPVERCHMRNIVRPTGDACPPPLVV